MQQCPRQDVHEAHDWWTGSGVARCPGLITYQMDPEPGSEPPRESALAAGWWAEDELPAWIREQHPADPGEPVERDGPEGAQLVLFCQALAAHGGHPWNRGEYREDGSVIMLWCCGRETAAMLPPGLTVHDLPRTHQQYVPGP